ncbi:MAG: class I SAM-dependent methyltransferase [Chlamydiales bacterium]|nr:class I SAM-dependent methyltransferase [Chlamydiia bacterium]MCP5507658.1 class I SAM-dependent methyltransferase [Chlamydiales bacterium]
MRTILKLLVCFLFAATLHAYEHCGEGIYIERNIPENHEGPRIAILTAVISKDQADKSQSYKSYNYADIVKFGTCSKEAYAKKNGYDYIIATEKLDDCYGIRSLRPLECAWSKLGLIARYLDQYDWVFWSDADSVFLNFDKRLEEYIDDQYALIACSIAPSTISSYVFTRASRINTGEVFYRNCEIAKFIIKEAWKNQKDITPGSFEQQRVNNCILDHYLEEYVKVYSQKHFNTSPSEFELGDFIVHMYAYHGRELFNKFNELEEKYGYIVKTVVEDLIANGSISLDDYLRYQGFSKIEGHCKLGGTTQPDFLETLVRERPHIHFIGEIGFKGGHSSEVFLQTRHDTQVISFDIASHEYVAVGKEYLDIKYPGRHQLIIGNSMESVPEFSEDNPSTVFDMVFIDGGHGYGIALADIINMQALSDENTVVIVDDLTIPTVRKAYDECIENGILKEISLHRSKHKGWAECRYQY